MKTKIKRISLFVVLITMLFFNAVYLNAKESMLEDRTIGDIVEKYQENPFRFNVAVFDGYEIEPKAEAPYVAGKLKNQYLEEALNCVNFMRYLVGLPADITLNEEYNNYAQHGAVILASLKGLTHFPEKPADMPEEFYELAYIGTSRANIAFGYPSIMDSIIGYMHDSIGESNINTVGHRRWILNPGMQQIGFGQCGIFHSTYTFDISRRPAIHFDFISWPARNYMPLEFFDEDTPWSVNLGGDYGLSSLDDIEVTLTRRSDNKVWVFNNSRDNTEKYGLFNVNDENYGMRKCIIFRPKDVGGYNKNDVFDVSIKGIKEYIEPEIIDGKLYTSIPAEINYTVEFFSLLDAIDEKEEDYIYGDLNDDGEINSMDLAVMSRHILEIKEISDIKAADLNGDGRIDTVDYQLLMRYILGIINGFPVE
ncbi:dockerin type I domain-containing protein [Acetivibrio saccincola]|uniref:Dockerin n=1 Tax=Acetivibrio saccincola TaxID=1677857 RepID=A0A2K9ELS0_9FIRM|nr:dockerin type I domain-containing protein [Acetivibrio saccincola]AUG58983.1 Endo-1,4-beta-xylanase Z precursor [Acetivibrio saccincola]NLW27391.1 dockerin [Acetivibrio saccincola]PQQ65927.1 dockerin [Acetivibrio saccincola]HOA96883.1 dockerin type I domain-containing protein [Acetivibrio saccincola]HQD28213.1 dockerin type I domain-containing protein [Acetivibrio saccincola]